MGGRLADELAAAREARFVGRRAERELFGSALGEEDPPWSVLWIHGPGGVGKSTLLEALAGDAARTGETATTLDGRVLATTGVTLRSAFDEVVRGADAGGPRSRSRPIVLVDALEHVRLQEDVLRNEVLPGLPGTALVVVASRRAPSPEWRVDPGWGSRLRIVSLRNLSPTEASSYLERCGVAAADRESLVAASHGHPLALSLLGDLAARGEIGGGSGGSGSGGSGALAARELAPLAHPELVAALLGRVVDQVPSATHRRALEVCAIARVTTEDLLRDALDLDDAGGLFTWLRDQPYVEAGPHGLWPHDLVRDVLDIELRWRDPATYRTVFRRVRAHVHGRLAHLRGAEQRRAIADEKFVFRNLPSVLSPVDWGSWGEADPEPARPDDRAAVLDLVRRFEGDEAAAIAETWWERQPHGFHVLRERDGRDGVRGVVVLVTLTDPSAGDLGFDPGAVAARAFADRHAPLRPGETMTQTRFVVDRAAYQAPSPTLNAVPVLTLQRYLQASGLAWDFLTLHEPDPLDDYFAIADLPRAAGADFVVGGRRYGLFAHDFRRVGVHDWLELVTERALRQDPAPPAPSAVSTVSDAGLVVLAHDAFVDAVRQALRDLLHPALLARNPLAGSRLVVERCGDGGPADPGAALAEVVVGAVEALAGHPREAKRFRALRATYLHPAPSQERAAEALGLPFSTYRRHLSEGVDRVVEHLWGLEVHGTPGG